MTAAQMTALGRALGRIGGLLNAAGRALKRRQWLRTGIFLRRATAALG